MSIWNPFTWGQTDRGRGPFGYEPPSTVDTYASGQPRGTFNILRWFRNLGAPYPGRSPDFGSRAERLLAHEKIKAQLGGLAARIWWLPFLRQPDRRDRPDQISIR